MIIIDPPYLHLFALKYMYAKSKAGITKILKSIKSITI